MSGHDPILDGTGGGYGRFTGVSVRDLTPKFEALANEGGMRSVSALLRITREQLEARNGLNHYPYLMVFAAIALSVLAIVRVFAPAKMIELLDKGVIAAIIALVTVTVGFFSTFRAGKESRAQSKLIRALALTNLDRIFSAMGFQPKPLDYDQTKILKDLLKSKEVQIVVPEGLLEG